MAKVVPYVRVLNSHPFRKSAQIGKRSKIYMLFTINVKFYLLSTNQKSFSLYFFKIIIKSINIH